MILFSVIQEFIVTSSYKGKLVILQSIGIIYSYKK